MKEKYTPYIQTQLENTAIARQYLAHPADAHTSGFSPDPLMEDEHEVVKGLVHKYDNRALIKVSYRCAAHCRFCTRYRQIGTAEGDLDEKDIENIISYLQAHEEIDDVILSGGDPLYTPRITVILLKELATIPSVKVIRIGTRLPVHSPGSFHSKLIRELIELAAQVNKQKPVHLLLNIEHPKQEKPFVFPEIFIQRF